MARPSSSQKKDGARAAEEGEILGRGSGKERGGDRAASLIPPEKKDPLAGEERHDVGTLPTSEDGEGIGEEGESDGGGGPVPVQDEPAVFKKGRKTRPVAIEGDDAPEELRDASVPFHRAQGSVSRPRDDRRAGAQGKLRHTDAGVDRGPVPVHEEAIPHRLGKEMVHWGPNTSNHTPALTLRKTST